jgi:integrase
MAYAKWKTDKRGRRKILVVRWRDSVAPGGWREERRPNDRTLTQAREYAHEMERRADLVAKGFASEPTRVTFGEIWDRWWEKDGRRRRSDSKHGFRQSLEKHLAALRPFVLVPATAGTFADKLESLLVEKLERHELAPQTVNHLRAGVFRMFEYARNPKVQLWRGENPITWVKRQQVPKRRYEVIRREQVRPLLAELPQALQGPAATILYAGLRPGEAFGLWKNDVDLEAGTVTVRRSWDQPFPKDEEVRTVIVVAELRQYLEAALKASARASPLVFTRPDGKAYKAKARWQIADQIRSALGRIGDVVGYDHTCRRCKRRAGRGETVTAFTWRHDDAAQRRCPTCQMKLWIAPVPRQVRLYDLRHSHATFLRKARVDLGTVQQQLGHSSPEITAGTYDHSTLEDDRETLERVLSFATIHEPLRPTGAPKALPPHAADASDAQSVPIQTPREINGVRAVSTDAIVCADGGRPWGASGRWFKSSRPDH